MRTITRDDITQALERNEKIVFVDTLKEEVFTEGHLPDAVNIPVEKTARLAPRLLKDKAAHIVTYSANEKCTSAREATAILEKLGYTNVMTYEGGKEEWQQSGLPFDGVSAEAA